MSNTAMSLRLHLAILVGKMALKASHIVGREGTILPGAIMERLCPSILAQLEAPERLVFITGTNGKTTTTNLLDDILSANGMSFVDNRAGGNITEGILASLVMNARLSGEPRKELGILEIDEHHTRPVFAALSPSMVVVTNLYRDSFVRNANPEYVLSVLKKAIPRDTSLILNADDLLSSQLGEGREQVTYFSVNRLSTAKEFRSWVANDLPDCPRCGGELVFEYCHLRHIGKARCKDCGYEGHSADFEVVRVDAPEEGAGTFVMRENNEPGRPEYAYHISSFTTSAIYNLAAAVVAARKIGLSPREIAEALDGDVRVTPSRYVNEQVCGVELIDALAKGWNPSACSSVMSMIHDASGRKAVVLIIDDYRAESSVVASDFMGWTYTADLELLADESVRQIVVAGSRAKDYELRLLLAGVKPEVITVVDNHYDIGDAVLVEDIDRVYWAYDWESDDVVKKTHARVAERIREVRN